MLRTSLLAGLAVMTMAATVCANFGPPYVPKDHKLIEPPVRFVGTDKFADHVFYLFYWDAYKGSRLVEVKGEEPIKLSFGAEGTRYPEFSMELLAVEREDFLKRKKIDPSLKWLHDKERGVLAAKADAPKAIAPASVKDIPVTTYRVTLKDGKLSATKSEPQKTSSAVPTGAAPTWMLGLALSMSLVWLGLWFARRANSARP
jgi:hypothetical protein